jgi:SAM-dependent methyltransferase
MFITDSRAPASFDAVAARYDETFTSSKIGQAQRVAVWTELGKTFRPGERVLEIGCGTGIDACFLAERGVQIVACDPSAEMIRVLRRRLEHPALRNLVEAHVLGAEDITRLQPAELFDGAFSNFGAINCSNPGPPPRCVGWDLIAPGSSSGTWSTAAGTRHSAVSSVAVSRQELRMGYSPMSAIPRWSLWRACSLQNFG